MKRWMLLLPALLAAVCVAGMVLEEDFKGYPDFDSMHRFWMFRGVGGEVLGGEYRFNGVSIEEPIQPDIKPLLVMGQPRDFPAGPKLALRAEISVGGKGFSFLDPAGKFERRLGLVILPKPFEWGVRDPLTLPTLYLTLDQAPDGKRRVRFEYAGERKLTPERRTAMDGGEWPAEGNFTLELSLTAGTATGKIIDPEGKLLYHGELRDPAFTELFAKAYPGFVNLRQEGAIRSFRADNFDSAPKAAEELRSVPLPESWQVSIGGGAPSPMVPDRRGRVDVGKAAGGHGPGRSARLECELSVPAAGDYLVNVRGDWFWKLSLDGKVIGDYSKKGNGNTSHQLSLPLKAGSNRLVVELGSGSAGWNFSFSPLSPEALKTKQAAQHLYGADRVYWNLDRLMDDVNRLARFGISLPGPAKELPELRRRIPATLSGRDALQYDSAFDRFYRAVYDGNRVLRLRDLRREVGGLAAVLGGSVTGPFDRLEKELSAAASKGDAAAVERTAVRAEQEFTRIFNTFDGWREGVTLGRGFGRFGWMTGDRVSRYTSGDGLLANQVLSSGALLRQYVTGGKDDAPWRLNFRFSGKRDEAQAARLAAEPAVGESREIEFGYDPTSFYAGGTPKAVSVKAVNWIRKRFAYGEAFTADMSLVSPALLLESAHDTLTVDDPGISPFSHFGYRDAKNRVVSKELAEGVVYDRGRDGEFGSNWLLFWGSDNGGRDLSGHRGCVPLEVIFQRHPQRIERKGKSLVFTLGRNGALWLNTPFGARLQPAGNWYGQLPPRAAGLCDVQARMALAYPEEVREYYRMEGENRVGILNHTRFRTFPDNDWKLEPLKFTALPPVLSLMTDRGFDAGLPDGLVDLGYPTIYGPLRAVPGDRIRYTLPVPEASRTAFARSLAAPSEAAAELARENRKLVEGGRFRDYCENIGRSWYSLRSGLPHVAKGWQYLGEEFQGYLGGLFRQRLGEFSSYRTGRYWRSLVEPYSGAKYFYSFTLGVGAPGNVGVFGDRGYGVGNHLLLLDHLSAASGCYDEVRKLWRDPAPLAPPEALRDGETVTVDKLLGYLKGVHDWAWMDGGSNDSGDNGPVVDCAQSAYGGYAALLRMAANFGDEPARKPAAYHLAKSQLSLIGRVAFRDYGHANGVLGPDHLNVGFREFITPDSYANSPMLGKLNVDNRSLWQVAARNEYDGSYDALLCYAYVDWLEVFFPYLQYVWPDFRHYEKERSLYWPNRDRGVSAGVNGHLYSRLIWRMLDGLPQQEAMKLFDHSFPKGNYFRQLAARELFPMLLTGGCPLTLAEWHPLALPRFTYDPAAKRAELLFRDVLAGYRFRAFAADVPARMLIDGQPADFECHDFRLTAAVPAGELRRVEFFWSEAASDRFRLLPPPPAPAGIPEAPGIDPAEFTPLPLPKKR